MTPRAWCLPNTLNYISKGLTESGREREERMGEGIKQSENWGKGGGKQFLPLCLVKGRAFFFLFFIRHTPTHTHSTDC